MLCAARMPSTAEEVIPPAWPPPSPAQYSPPTDNSQSALRKKLTGDELRVSGAVSTASAAAKLRIFLSSSTIPSRSAAHTNSGSTSEI